VRVAIDDFVLLKLSKVDSLVESEWLKRHNLPKDRRLESGDEKAQIEWGW
jgi:hypothetical protein